MGLNESKSKESYSARRTVHVDFDSLVHSLDLTNRRLTQMIGTIQSSGKNCFDFEGLSKVVNKIETDIQQLGDMVPTLPDALKQRDAKKLKSSGKDGRYLVSTNRHIDDSISMLSSKNLRFMNATNDTDLLSCLQKVFPKLNVTLYTLTEPLAAFDTIVLFGRFQSRIETDSNDALQHIPPDVHSRTVLIMFHQTRGSKTADDVFEVTYKHENVQDQLHIPFREYPVQSNYRSYME